MALKRRLAAALLTGLLPTAALALELSLDGGESAHRDAVADTLPARRLAALESPAGARFWIRRLPTEAARALEPFGYYHAQVTAELVDDQVRVRIEPGLPVRVRSVAVSFGDSDVVPETGFPLAPGAVLDHRQYERGKQAIHTWLLGHGYLKTRLETAEVRVHRGRREAEIELAWQPGPRYRFGPVQFGESPLDPEFLRRYVPLSPGEPYTEEALQKLSENLRTSGYYGAVDIRPAVPDDGSLEVPIEVLLTPRKRSVYQAGVVYATDAGPGLEAGVERRWLNRQGHTMRSQLELASRRSLAAIRYEIPSASSIDRQFRFDLNYVDEETDTSERQTATLGASRQSRWGPWRRTESISLLDEDFVVGDQPGTSTLLLGALDLARTESDGQAVPMSGWRASANLQAAAEALASDTDIVRLETLGKMIFGFGGTGRLLLRGQFGALWADDFQSVPASLRFFAGGDRSVRGFDYNALSPRDDEGNALGGEFLAVASAEFDWPLRPGWRIATFVDAGNAFGAGNEEFAWAVGVGIRWLTPVGPLRLDVATPGSDSNDSFRIHFSAGPDL